MSRNALQIFKDEDPAGYHIMEVAAQMTRSDKVSAHEKLVLLVQISDVVAPYLVKAAAEAAAEIPEKPKYRWVNGARVKVV